MNKAKKCLAYIDKLDMTSQELDSLIGELEMISDTLYDKEQKDENS